MTDYLVPILIITALIVVNGLFVAAEFAIVGSRKSRLEVAGKGSAAARFILRVLDSPASQDRFIAIAQLGITVATIGLGMYGEPSIANWVYGPAERLLGVSTTVAHTIGTVVAVLVMTYFHVVVGEMIPKALALQEPERTAMTVSTPMRVVGTIFRPLVSLLNGTGNLILRMMGIYQAGESRLYSSAELLQLVEESHEGGMVSEEEERLIRNILDFGEREVQEVMVPRTRVAALPIEATADEIRETMRAQGYSRYPVYRGSLDTVVGVLHVRDFIEKDVRGEKIVLRDMLRRVPRVTEGTYVETVLAAFKRLRVHMALVVDEHGGTAGVVTLEDILEEVVGDVEDELDADDQPEIEELGDGRFLVSGGLPIYHFNERFGLELESEDSTTLAGYVLERLKRVPEVGDSMAEDHLRLTVRHMEGLAIDRILVEIGSDMADGSDATGSTGHAGQDTPESGADAQGEEASRNPADGQGLE